MSGKSPFGSLPSWHAGGCKLLSVYTAAPSVCPFFGINYTLSTELGLQISKPHQDHCVRQQTIPQNLLFPDRFLAGGKDQRYRKMLPKVQVLLFNIFSLRESCCVVLEIWQHSPSRGGTSGEERERRRARYQGTSLHSPLIYLSVKESQSEIS